MPCSDVKKEPAHQWLDRLTSIGIILRVVRSFLLLLRELEVDGLVLEPQRFQDYDDFLQGSLISESMKWSRRPELSGHSPIHLDLAYASRG